MKDTRAKRALKKIKKNLPQKTFVFFLLNQYTGTKISPEISSSSLHGAHKFVRSHYHTYDICEVKQKINNQLIKC